MKTNNINKKNQYIMFDLNILNEDIWYWENVISSPKELVDFLEYLDSEEESYIRIPKWQPWESSAEDKHRYGSVKKIIYENFNNSTKNKKIDQQTLYIINSFMMAVEMCYEKYIQGHNLNLNDYFCQSKALVVKKWLPGKDMGKHFDGQGGDTTLAFTLVSYLNDDYEGGEISFPNHGITLKPKPGSLIMFPSQMPYIHEVLPIKSGIRYMMVALVIKKNELGQIEHSNYE
jgi:hypothetical protein